MKEKFLLKFSNMRIRNKIMVIYIPLIILPLFFVLYTSKYTYSKSIIEKTQTNIANESSLIAQRIENMKSNVETCANLITKDINRAYTDMNENSNDSTAYVLANNKISTVINYQIQAFKDIESAAYIDIRSNIIVSNTKLLDNSDDVLETDLVKTLNKSGPPDTMNIWFTMQKRDYMVKSDQSPVLTLGKKIVDMETGYTKGYIFFNISEKTISSVFPDSGYGGEKGYFIIDKNGSVISTRQKQDLLKPMSNKDLYQQLMSGRNKEININMDNEQYLISSMPLKVFDWKLINQIPLKELTGEVNKNFLINITVGAICVILAFIGTLFLSRLIANPIINLTNDAKEVKNGNLNVIIKVDSADEIGILGSVFNEMILNIKELLNKVKTEQKKKREYELALIQSQIKPHFLYNSLDLIYVLCEMGEGSKASNITKALADFYRASLSKGKEIINIRDELQNVKDYLFIQQERYSDILDFKFDVSKEIMNYSILKLTLQPLVENSIYHGLKPKSERGIIIINGYEEENNIVLKVIDDGVGIPESKIKELLNNKNSETSKNSFGLRSVDERMKLYYGEEYGIRIISEPGKGTEISVIIPKRQGGNNV